VSWRRKNTALFVPLTPEWDQIVTQMGKPVKLDVTPQSLGRVMAPFFMPGPDPEKQMVMFSTMGRYANMILIKDTLDGPWRDAAATLHFYGNQARGILEMWKARLHILIPDRTRWVTWET
jgi:hypothetical protein